MMYRSVKYLVFAILACQCVVAGAQQEMSEAAPVLRHQFGFNTLGLLDIVRTEESGNTYRSPYLFTYSLELGRVVLRAAIGPEYTSQVIVRDGFSDTEENTVLRLDSRAGAGIIVLNDQRWQAVAGVDAAMHYRRDRSIEDSGFDRITTQEETKSYGGGPFLQFGYHVSRRVSVGAEVAAYWMSRTTTVTELFENFPDFNNVVNENSGSELDITLPNTVFVRFHF